MGAGVGGAARLRMLRWLSGGLGLGVARTRTRSGKWGAGAEGVARLRMLSWPSVGSGLEAEGAVRAGMRTRRSKSLGSEVEVGGGGRGWRVKGAGCRRPSPGAGR